MLSSMGSRLVERRIIDTHERMKRIKQELLVLDEQLVAVREEAEDLRVRSLVSQVPQADFEYKEARKHLEAMSRTRDALVVKLDQLRIRRDKLLIKLPEEPK